MLLRDEGQCGASAMYALSYTVEVTEKVNLTTHVTDDTHHARSSHIHTLTKRSLCFPHQKYYTFFSCTDTR